MKFEELFAKSIEMWPDEIDISDATSTGDGLLSRNLSHTWSRVEEKAKSMGEWYDLMTWCIFKSLHTMAKRNFQKGILLINKEQLDTSEVKQDLLENLQDEDYKDMLEEFENIIDPFADETNVLSSGNKNK